ncbi:MAG: C69 family dipeptidase [Gemmatimonadota bacterium]|jgi:dipeptidase
MSHRFCFPRIRFPARIAVVFFVLFFTSFLSITPSAAQEGAANPPCECTSVLAGRLATTDGSTITSHTCDGGSRTWIEIVPGGTHEAGETVPIWNKQIKRTEFAGDMRGLEALGEIPQAAETYQFVHPVYPSMNEHQLAMGETTIGGRRELRSSEGIFSIEELQKVVMARTRTARDAILMMGSLAEEYGYVDTGECLTVIDPEEAWFFEIFGPGNGRKGAVWAAVRIPDDHVAVSANIPRIAEIDPSDTENYLTSENVLTLATEMGWWDPESGTPFKMWEAYSGRRPFSIREYWALSQLAPSMGLRFDAEELPLSVKPDVEVSARSVMDLLGATYEGSEFDMLQNLKVPNRRTGEMELSPVANPWMSQATSDLLNALKPGTVERQRTIAVNAASYSTVIQARGWLPDPIGGVMWLGFDCPALIPRIPVFAGAYELPPDFLVSSKHRFRRDAAAWAFHRAVRLSQITFQRDKEIILGVREAFLNQAFAELPAIEQEALNLFRENPTAAIELLNAYSNGFARSVVDRMWEVGDEIWLKYVSGF